MLHNASRFFRVIERRPNRRPEQIIAAAIEQHAQDDPPALARAILAALDHVGLAVRAKYDLIPIRGNQ